MTMRTEQTQEMTGEYAVGKQCTFHGHAGTLLRDGCPRCGGEVTLLPAEEWSAQAQAAEKANPGYGAMFAWGRGRCFPDLDTLENAYRQAMEE